MALQDAVSFLTILPVSGPMIRSSPPKRMCRALAWFPLVGAFIGSAGAGFTLLCLTRWQPPVAAALGLTAMILLTGGLHLDGFADTLDGLGAWKGREETLSIMRDSRIGVMAAAGLFLLLSLKWALIQSIPTDRLLPGLMAACSLSRLSMALSAQIFPYVPGKTGLGRLATEERSAWAIAFAGILGVAIGILCLGFSKGTVSVAAAAGVTGMLNRLFLARMGGITGDTLGAVNEMVEVSLLLVVATA